MNFNLNHYYCDILMTKDIKYRGFLTIRSMRILGYFLILLTQFCLIIYSLSETYPIPKWLVDFASIYDFIAPLSLPILLFALFSSIISDRNNIEKFIFKYLNLSLIFYFITVLLFDRYIVGFIASFSEDFATAYADAEAIMKSLFGTLINYNIFVDLLLFSLFFYFVMCKPKSIKTKNGLIAFRLLSLIPIIIVVVTSILYGLYGLGTINLPIEVLSILPCKSPMIYLVFFGIIILSKIRQRHLQKNGITQAQYINYLKSNKNSLRFSIVSSLVVLIVCIIDFLIYLLLPQAEPFGLGISFPMVMVVPFLLCLSYTKQSKRQSSDNLIIVIFVFLMIILYLETALYIFQTPTPEI